MILVDDYLTITFMAVGLIGLNEFFFPVTKETVLCEDKSSVIKPNSLYKR